MQERSENSSLELELSVPKDSAGGNAQKPYLKVFCCINDPLSIMETKWEV